MELLKQHIEALIFSAELSVKAQDIHSCLKTIYGWDVEIEQVNDCINELIEKYKNEEYSFEIVEIADGFRFFSKKEFHASIQALNQLKNKKRLSTAAMETLSIIAYKQPVTKPEMEQIRGVSCDYSVQRLLEKELIEIKGKSDTPGKPLLYVTSKTFMDYFGLSSVKELPQLKDLKKETESEIGTPVELEND
ncbi:MAG: SMC-Scp complex subunit ScpB [Chitinophagales bacterium]|nr:SMC-Scp complex subunit ScpB [Chitinophagales bacterium]